MKSVGRVAGVEHSVPGNRSLGARCARPELPPAIALSLEWPAP
jgi:hypothetical protein